jgi:hypothetical protein
VPVNNIGITIIFNQHHMLAFGTLNENTSVSFFSKKALNTGTRNYKGKAVLKENTCGNPPFI